MEGEKAIFDFDVSVCFDGLENVTLSYTTYIYQIFRII